MTDTAVFSCSICEAASREICVLCTKDACPNHLCLRCRRCIDCCICEMPRTAAAVSEPVLIPEPAVVTESEEEQNAAAPDAESTLTPSD